MRDFDISEAQSRLAYGRVTWIVHMVKNWRMRKILQQLQAYSDYQLHDIGLTRGELAAFIDQPLDRDTAWEAERRVLLESKQPRTTPKKIPAFPISRRASPHWSRLPAFILQRTKTIVHRNKL